MSNTAQGANPFTVPEAFDTITIGGETMPGIAVVKAERKHKYDEKKTKGSKGSTLTYAGSDLVDITIDLTIFDQEGYDDWIAKAPALLPDPKNPKALDAVHPHLDAVNVSSIVMVSTPAPVHEGGGKWTVALKAKEFVAAPKAASGTPDGSTGAKGGTGTSAAASTAQSAQEAEIARLLAEAKKP